MSKADEERSPTPKSGSFEKDDLPRVSLRDIAKRLGISHVAVSLALRERPGVSEELRQKVKATAKELGYRPDPALTALNIYRRNRQSRSINSALAWITMWRDPARFHAFKDFENYWLGAREIAEKHGYHLYEFHPDERDSLKAVQRVLQARNIEGVFLSPPESHYAQNCPVLDWKRFSVVRFGHTFDSLPFHLVTSSQSANTILAMHCMRQRGYRRIGFVTSQYFDRNAEFLNGFLRANVDLPAKERIPHLSLPEEDAQADGETLARWIHKNQPDAILSNLKEIRKLLETIGFNVPEKLGLAVTSVQDCDADAGIDQCSYEIGKAACELLISLLMNRHHGIPSHSREVLVEGRWVDGESLPARKPAHEKQRDMREH